MIHFSGSSPDTIQLVPPIEGARRELEELIMYHQNGFDLNDEHKNEDLLRSISLPSFPESFKV